MTIAETHAFPREENLPKPIISLRDVVKTYGRGELQIKALKKLSMDIYKGEIVTIMGPSGSGKSTLLNILGTMDKPTQGEVLFDGLDIAQIRERKMAKYRRQFIGFVFQNFYLLPNLNVLDNVLSPLL